MNSNIEPGFVYSLFVFFCAKTFVLPLLKGSGENKLDIAGSIVFCFRVQMKAIFCVQHVADKVLYVPRLQ